MADNVTLNAGTGGATLAADDIAGTHHQRVKVQYGVDGAATDVSDTNPMPVDDAGGSITVDAAELTAIQAAVQIMDDWDETDRAKVNIIVGQAGIAAGAGAVGVTVPRVTLASDDPAVAALQILDNAISGSEMQVDVVAALPAGTNNIGDVDVLSVVPGTGATNLGKAIDSAAGATDTGVAVLAIRDDSLSALTPAEDDYVPLRVSSTGALHVTGGGGGTEYTVDAAAPAAPTGATFVMERDDQLAALTEIEGDWTNPRASSKGALWVTIPDTNGDPITSFGGGTQYAVDAALGATPTGTLSVAIRDDALSALTPVEGDAIGMRVDANGALWTHDDVLDAVVAGSELQVDVVAALPAGTNAIGKLAANTGVDIGDVDVTSVIPGTAATNLGKAEDGGHTSGDVGVMALGVRNDTPNVALAGTDLDYSPIAVYKDGSLRLAPPESDFAVLGSNSVKKYYTNAGAVTDGIVWSPAAGKRWYVTDIYVQTSAASTITLEDDLAGGDSPVWKGEFAANSGWSHSYSTPLFSGEDAADLIITTTAGNVYVTVTGYEI